MTIKFPMKDRKKISVYSGIITFFPGNEDCEFETAVETIVAIGFEPLLMSSSEDNGENVIDEISTSEVAVVVVLTIVEMPSPWSPCAWLVPLRISCIVKPTVSITVVTAIDLLLSINSSLVASVHADDNEDDNDDELDDDDDDNDDDKEEDDDKDDEYSPGELSSPTIVVYEGIPFFPSVRNVGEKRKDGSADLPSPRAALHSPGIFLKL